MTYFTAIILGIVEGATEFIPVSSSGHLILARSILSVNDSLGLSFDAVLQLSSTIALIIYFWKDLWKLFLVFIDLVTQGNVSDKDRILLYSIILGTIPAVIFGLLLESKMDTIFRNVTLVSVSLIAGSLLLWLGQKFAKENNELSVGRGIMVGLFQCIALIPGISRSGATISGGLFSGLTKEEAVRFSFLLSVPVLFGSGLKKVFEIRHEIFSTNLGPHLLIGSLASFIVGLVSINFLIKYLKKNNLNIFVWYRVGLAILILIYFFN
jgi:undecaprenyl-diphosphatase